MEKPVQFYSEAVPMAGVLFLPDNLARAERRPGIVAVPRLHGGQGSAIT